MGHWHLVRLKLKSVTVSINNICPYNFLHNQVAVKHFQYQVKYACLSLLK